MTSSQEKIISKILIIDGFPASVEIVSGILKKGNYQIALAKNGISGIEKAKTNNFDLILLNIELSDNIGYEVCKKLKKNSKTKDTPIIFLSENKDAKSIAKCFKAGGVDYIGKPFIREELLARVKIHIESKLFCQKLKKEKNMAETVAHSKAMFLANMSHEIRTPLNGIVGMIDILNQTNLNDEQRNIIDIIDISSENLLKIINGTLDFSKIESEQIELENIKFNLKNLIEDILKLLSFSAYAKGLEISFKIAHKIPKTVKGDPVRLRQVLINLINNAIKFTSKGSIKILVELVNEDSKKIKLKFKIIDTGIGISEEKYEEIFKPFG